MGGDGGCSVPVEAVVPDVQPVAARNIISNTGTSDTRANRLVLTIRPPRRFIRLSSAASAGQSNANRGVPFLSARCRDGTSRPSAQWLLVGAACRPGARFFLPSRGLRRATALFTTARTAVTRKASAIQEPLIECFAFTWTALVPSSATMCPPVPGHRQASSPPSGTPQQRCPRPTCRQTRHYERRFTLRSFIYRE